MPPALINMFYYLHSITRWLVAVATVVALAYVIYQLATNRPWDDRTRRVMSAFSSLVGLQWLLGILYYGVFGSYLGSYSIPYQIAHASWMTGALVVAHLYMAFRRRGGRIALAGSLASVALTIVCVWFGVSALPQNWRVGFQPPAVADTNNAPAGTATPAVE